MNALSEMPIWKLWCWGLSFDGEMAATLLDFAHSQAEYQPMNELSSNFNQA
jgi:hypothetical protein